MPAYNSSFLFTIFFIVYILINTYIFMSVFLAVVYNNYKKYLKVWLFRVIPISVSLSLSLNIGSEKLAREKKR